MCTIIMDIESLRNLCADPAAPDCVIRDAITDSGLEPDRVDIRRFRRLIRYSHTAEWAIRYDAALRWAGRKCTVSDEYDDGGPPWEDCGHGPVSGPVRRKKRPGEWLLCSEGHTHRYYDAEEAMALAMRDGWGVKDPPPGATRRQIAELAVRADYEHLKGWFNDEWSYRAVTVEHDETGESESLCRVEGNSPDYLEYVTAELAHTLRERLRGDE